MEQPQKTIEAIGKALLETCTKLDEVQVRINDIIDKAKSDFDSVAAVLIDLAKKEPENGGGDATTTD